MLFAARAALLCALLFGALGAARPDGVARLLERMRAEAGPVWRLHIRSVSHTTVNGDTTTVVTDTSGPQSDMRQCIGEVCVGTYFDGTRLFSTNLNDTALPRSSAPEEDLRALRIVSSLAFLAPDFAGSGGHVEDAGDGTIDGSNYRALLIRATGAVPIIAYVDPVTALVRYARDVEGSTLMEFRDYRRVPGGVLLPFSVLRNDTAMERYEDRAVVAAPFAPPHGLTVTLPSSAQSVSTDPSSSSPVFPCTLAGVATKCLLDTGNSGVSISLELAETLNAPSIGAFEVHGLGHYATEVVRLGPLTVGATTFSDANYVVLHDIHHFGYDVVLGADVIAAANVELDQQAHTVAFGVPEPDRAACVPLTFVNFVPVVRVAFGELDTELAVDTGDESNINLSSDFYEQHPDLFNATDQQEVRGVGGTSIERIGKVAGVRVGSFSVGEQRVGETQTLRGTASGHLGAGFLEHFRVIFDYAAQRLQLVPLEVHNLRPARR